MASSSEKIIHERKKRLKIVELKYESLRAEFQEPAFMTSVWNGQINSEEFRVYALSKVTSKFWRVLKKIDVKMYIPKKRIAATKCRPWPKNKFESLLEEFPPWKSATQKISPGTLKYYLRLHAQSLVI
jgi:hypothetical protein